MIVNQKVFMKTEDIIKVFFFSPFNSLVLFSESCIDNLISIKKKIRVRLSVSQNKTLHFDLHAICETTIFK